MYSPELLDHFEHPRHAGDLDAADASVQVQNPACGDILKLGLRLVDGLLEVRFKAKGCVPAIACGSAVSELASGKTAAEARQIRREAIVQAVGGLPPASSHASHLAMDALAAALEQIG